MKSPHESMPALIIERPELQPPLQRTVFQMLTFVAWALYLYLWLPLLTLAAWWLAARTGLRAHVIANGDAGIDSTALVLLLKMVVVACVLLIGWAEYNRLRFQGRERRKPHAMVGLDDTARAFGVSTDVARELRVARTISVTIDTQMQPGQMSVEICAAPVEPPPDSH